jgi:hypothetical protein
MAERLSEVETSLKIYLVQQPVPCVTVGEHQIALVGDQIEVSLAPLVDTRQKKCQESLKRREDICPDPCGRGFFCHHTFRTKEITSYLQYGGTLEYFLAILMTIYQPLPRRGLHPLETIAVTLRSFASSGSLPPLPDSASIG